jgi:hypothetical protein
MFDFKLQGVKTVSEELDELAFSRHRIYKAPGKNRMKMCEEYDVVPF